MTYNKIEYAGITQLELSTLKLLKTKPESLLVIVQNEDQIDFWLIDAPTDIATVQRFYAEQEQWVVHEGFNPFGTFTVKQLA